MKDQCRVLTMIDSVLVARDFRSLVTAKDDLGYQFANKKKNMYVTVVANRLGVSVYAQQL